METHYGCVDTKVFVNYELLAGVRALKLEYSQWYRKWVCGIDVLLTGHNSMDETVKQIDGQLVQFRYLDNPIIEEATACVTNACCVIDTDTQLPCFRIMFEMSFN